MLRRAADKICPTDRNEKKQAPLRLNTSAVNTPQSQSPPNLKRKLGRSMSTVSGLGSLHQQSFDENTAGGFVDLTSPEKDCDVHYPSINTSESISYPSLPPPHNGSPPLPSSAPVPWSSSPPSHYDNPVSKYEQKQRSPPDVPRPAKRRVMPASFETSKSQGIEMSEDSSAWRNGNDKQKFVVGGKEANASRTGVEATRFEYKSRFDKTAAPKQSSTRTNRASVMSDMLEKASMPRQRQLTPMSRTSSDKSMKSSVIPAKAQKPAAEKVPDVFLSEEQRAVMKAVMEEGKSVFFTGSAGTGKSVLMKAIIAQLRHKHRTDPDRIAITASTGLASCILEGQTLHSWSGVGLGKEPAPELIKKIKRNMKARQRWLRTKALIIDEISMVDGVFFDKLEQVARTIRNNGRPFGGIQLIFTGDFFQLPPVPERNTESKFVFDAVTWNTCIEHTILLTNVFRQKDEHFARMLNEMRLGKMSPETVREFKSLSRPLDFHDDLEATELYPRRDEVENANQNRMRKLSGQIMTFDAVDSGVQEMNTRKALLANFLAPEKLELKKGAQVMLIKNIDHQLVNGSLGIVQSFMDEGTFFTYKEDEPNFLLAQEGDDSLAEEAKAAARSKIQAARMKNATTGSPRLWPMVRFNLPDGTSRAMLCIPDEWKTESQTGEVLAKRVQIPLILAWALSIHKAQGQTLSRVKVDLGKVFEKGQAYVALSRATSKAGLQVLRFDERKVMVHQKVLQFYSKLSSHETLEKRQAATIVGIGSSNTMTARKEAVRQVMTTTIDDDDDFGDDVSYEEMLAAEAEVLRGSGSG